MKLTQVHRLRLRRRSSSAALLYLLEAIDVDVARSAPRGHETLLQSIDALRSTLVARRCPRMSAALLVRAVPRGMAGLAAVEAQPLGRRQWWRGALARGMALAAAVPASLLPLVVLRGWAGSSSVTVGVLGLTRLVSPFEQGDEVCPGHLVEIVLLLFAVLVVLYDRSAFGFRRPRCYV